MNTFDEQGNYIDENGKIIKRAYRIHEKTKDPKLSEAERQKMSEILKNFDISKISGRLNNDSETGQ